MPGSVHVAIGANGDEDPLGRTLALSCDTEELAGGTIALSFSIDPGDGSTFSGNTIYIDPSNGALLGGGVLTFEDSGYTFRGNGGMSTPSAAQPCQLTPFQLDGSDLSTTIVCRNIAAMNLTTVFRDVVNPIGDPFTLELTNCD
jgi:hypothetical protein